jgi:hypothetical protein
MRIKDAISSEKELPDWFSIKKYQRARQFTAKDWLEQLSIRKALREYVFAIKAANTYDEYMDIIESDLAAYRITAVDPWDRPSFTSETVIDMIENDPMLDIASESHLRFFFETHCHKTQSAVTGLAAENQLRRSGCDALTIADLYLIERNLNSVRAETEFSAPTTIHGSRN